MPILPVPELKKRPTNLKEDAYIANVKEDAILLFPQLGGILRVCNNFVTI